MINLNDFLETGTIITANDTAYMGWGKRNWSSQPIKGTTNFYFPDFFLSSETPWFTQEHIAIFPVNTLHQKLPANTTNNLTLEWTTSHHPLFLNEMKNLKIKFNDGKLQKAVPYAFLESQQSLSKDQLLHSLYAGLEAIQSSPGNLYGFWDENEGILGLTPEILFEGSKTAKGNSVKTIAVAGTSSASLPPETLLDDPKTFHEHQLVVKGIKESLSPYGIVVTEECRLLPMKHLTHLATSIELIASTPISFERLVVQLHPTPALGAYPKEAGQEWLRSYAEKIPRGRHGAPAGVLLSPSEFICVVAIRNVQWDALVARIVAGCGVVSQSKDVEEWQEIQLKWSAIRKTLKL